MTPERALTISRVLAFNWEQDDESLSNLADRIRDAILQACAEEREACIKIAEDYAKSAGNMYARRSGRSVAAAIRGAK